MLLDDRWLNQVEEWLGTTASFCERAYGRKPSIEDLRTLVATVLSVGSPDWFSDGDRRVVKTVTFETAARPALPKKLLAGHILALPLGRRTYAFARVMKTEPEWLIGVIIEVFRKLANAPLYDPTVLASGRLFRPLCINHVSCVRSGRWQVVGLDKAYRVPKADERLEFPAAPSGTFTAVLPFRGGELGRKLSTKEFWALSDAVDVEVEVVEKRIREHTGLSKRSPPYR